MERASGVPVLVTSLLSDTRYLSREGQVYFVSQSKKGYIQQGGHKVVHHVVPSNRKQRAPDIVML